jgi:hypothetical protein
MQESSVHGNEHSCFINGEEFIDQLRDYKRFKIHFFFMELVNTEIHKTVCQK